MWPLPAGVGPSPWPALLAAAHGRGPGEREGQERGGRREK